MSTGKQPTLNAETCFRAFFPKQYFYNQGRFYKLLRFIKLLLADLNVVYLRADWMQNWNFGTRELKGVLEKQWNHVDVDFSDI